MEGMSKADKKAYKKQKKQRALEMANGEFDQEQNLINILNKKLNNS